MSATATATANDAPVADIDILDRVRAGDKSAIAVLWTIYQPQLLRLLRARGAAGPEDLASQVWLDVGRGFDNFRGDGVAFRRWIFTIAGRRAIDEARRVERRGEVSAATLDHGRCVTVLDDGFDASAAVDRTLALIKQLQPTSAEAVLLRVVYQMSVAEVAEITGHSEANVRVLVHRGLARLRTILGQYYAAASSPSAA